MDQGMHLKNITKIFGDVVANSNISISFEPGQVYAIRGHSGSGKSTLLSIMGLLDRPTEGKLILMGKDVSQLNEKARADTRMRQIGFVFQEFYLNESLRAYENIMVPLMINPNCQWKEVRKTAFRLLDQMGLSERAAHYPRELSGGEKQRVAIARALANDPQFILADEPTGNLDAENENNILNILKLLSQKGKTVIIATHSNEVLEYADQILSMNKGALIS